MIALDLSRLLSRARYTTPTGIDRVEMAYARYLVSRGGTFCFAARNARCGIGLLPAELAAEFIERLVALWRDGMGAREQRQLIVFSHRLRLAALFGEGALRAALSDADGPIYVSVSQQHLDKAGPIARLKRATGARFLCLIHDLIPLDFPELTRPRQTRRHQRRLAAVAAHADAIIANSEATRDAIVRRLSCETIPIVAAPLAADRPHPVRLPSRRHPYFVCLGTIERRKNHDLLLTVWKRLSHELGDAAPHLLLIGRRGFGAEQITTCLGALDGLVTECPDLSDSAVSHLLRSARAMLLPSVAEGFGLPVVEALAVGVPVLCSNLPALREAGADVPEYLDPANTTAWHHAVVDYVDDTPRREAQLARLACWHPPSWAEHFVIVEQLIAGLNASHPGIASCRRDRAAQPRLASILQ